RIIQILLKIEGPVYDGSVMLGGGEEHQRFAAKEEALRVLGVKPDRLGGLCGGTEQKGEKELLKAGQHVRRWSLYAQGACGASRSSAPYTPGIFRPFPN